MIEHLLLSDPAEHDTLRTAIFEWVSGRPGHGLEKWRAEREAKIAAWRSADHWQKYRADARRRDGVSVNQGYPVFVPLPQGQEIDPADWYTVSFPPAQGDRPPTVAIQAPSLADACGQVDERFPMSAWWMTVGAMDVRGPAASIK